MIEWQHMQHQDGEKVHEQTQGIGREALGQHKHTPQISQTDCELCMCMGMWYVYMYVCTQHLSDLLGYLSLTRVATTVKE